MESDYRRIQKFIKDNEWHFAKTMAYIPHWYCLLKEYGNQKEFTWVVDFMRKNGRPSKFGNTVYRYFYLNGYKYWDMDPTPEECDLINRDKYKKPFLFADEGLFAGVNTYESDPEWNTVCNVIKGQVFGNVFEIGCEDGISLKMTDNIQQYIGCTTNPAKGRLLLERHPKYYVYEDKAENIFVGVPNWIVSLFGHADEIADALAVERILSQTNDDTKLFLMFENPKGCISQLDKALGLRVDKVGKYSVYYRM